MDLPAFIVTALPTKGFKNVDWDYLAGDSSILWLTDGIKRMDTGMSVRHGIAHITVSGKPPQELRRIWQDLPWSITLSAKGNPRFGPDKIEIQPGSYKPQDSCFGSRFTGCSFAPEEALKSDLLTARLICKTGQLGDDIRAYSVSSPGKESSLAVYVSSEGSGGKSAWLDIMPLAEAPNVCSPPTAANSTPPPPP
jgi:hypothetical protein